jgi:alpha-tubulin suppressor-like RCC1 family protein
MSVTASVTLSTSITPSPSPTQVWQVAAGGQHSCAVLSNGAVRCWGANAKGQLGYGWPTIAYLHYPSTDVWLGSYGALQLGLGSSHSCALLWNGGVRCWGYNNYGQLGVGDTTDRYSAPSVDIALGAAATQVTAGDMHTCALTSSGGVRCWGWNGDGELGNCVTSSANVYPSGDVNLHGVTAVHIAAGMYHTCAVTSTGGEGRCGAVIIDARVCVCMYDNVDVCVCVCVRACVRVQVCDVGEPGTEVRSETD